MATSNQKRDYRAEYQRRIKRGLKRGLSLSQARGHPSPGESYIRVPTPVDDRALQISLKALRSGMSLQDAAREAGLSAQRFRNEASSKGAIHKQGNRWAIKPRQIREMLVFSGGQSHELRISQFRQASLIGRHMSAVGDFLRTNDPDYLEPFEGKSVQDAEGSIYPLETNPNSLYRINASGADSFEQIYRIVI